MNPAININSYSQDGFVKVCTVIPLVNGNWNYQIHCPATLYSDHTSWVYFICDGDEIVKVGESGIRLGIKTRDGQPLIKSNNRLGRYRGCGETDQYIREELWQQAIARKVSIWARKCPITSVQVAVGTNQVQVYSAHHKDLELAYLDHILAQGDWPRLNKMRK